MLKEQARAAAVLAEARAASAIAAPHKKDGKKVKDPKEPKKVRNILMAKKIIKHKMYFVKQTFFILLNSSFVALHCSSYPTNQEE